MAQPECSSTSTKYGYQQLHNVDTALGQLERVGFGPGTDAYDTLWRQRGAILGNIGYKASTSYDWLTFLAGGSPGTMRLGHDAERGWFAEIRDKPGAPPVYKSVNAEEAMAVLKEEISPELHDRLFAPDDYLGE